MHIHQNFFVPFDVSHNPDFFILNDILYFTTKKGVIIIFDLINKSFSSLEKNFEFFGRGATMVYHQGYIYYFGGTVRDERE